MNGNGDEVAKNRRPRPGLTGVRSVYVFEPMEDLTVGELAGVMELLLAGISGAPPSAVDAIFQDLEDGVQRHFEVKGKPSIVVPR